MPITAQTVDLYRYRQSKNFKFKQYDYIIPPYPCRGGINPFRVFPIPPVPPGETRGAKKKRQSPASARVFPAGSVLFLLLRERDPYCGLYTLMRCNLQPLLKTGLRL